MLRSSGLQSRSDSQSQAEVILSQIFFKCCPALENYCRHLEFPCLRNFPYPPHRPLEGSINLRPSGHMTLQVLHWEVSKMRKQMLGGSHFLARNSWLSEATEVKFLASCAQMWAVVSGSMAARGSLLAQSHDAVWMWSLITETPVWLFSLSKTQKWSNILL